MACDHPSAPLHEAPDQYAPPAAHLLKDVCVCACARVTLQPSSAVYLPPVPPLMYAVLVLFLHAGPAASLHPGDAEVLDGSREARLGEGELQAGVVARGHPVGQRAQRRSNGGAEAEGEEGEKWFLQRHESEFDSDLQESSVIFVPNSCTLASPLICVSIVCYLKQSVR